MNPISTLTIGHIGSRVRIVDESITLAGILYAVDAEKAQVVDHRMDGNAIEMAGGWENITVTVGINRVNLHPDATWEPA